MAHIERIFLACVWAPSWPSPQLSFQRQEAVRAPRALPMQRASALAKGRLSTRISKRGRGFVGARNGFTKNSPK